MSGASIAKRVSPDTGSRVGALAYSGSDQRRTPVLTVVAIRSRSGRPMLGWVFAAQGLRGDS